MKQCRTCKAFKDNSEFDPCKKMSHLLKKSCRDCHRLRSLSANRKRQYGIDSNMYNKQLFLQDNSCAICGKHQLALSKNLAIDHDHITGEFRGLLCTNCNVLLGLAHDDIDILLSAIGYLQR